MDDENWVIALVGGIMLVGQERVEDIAGHGIHKTYLEPCYHLQRGLMHSDRGSAIVCQVSLLGMFANWRRVELAPGTPLLEFSDLTPHERTEIETGIRRAEEFRTGMRAASAGIVMAGPGTKLPPIQGVK